MASIDLKLMGSLLRIKVAFERSMECQCPVYVDE